MIESDRFEQVLIETVDELRGWFTTSHASDGSMWLVTYKKAVEDKYV
jgi:hypothetical protein